MTAVVLRGDARRLPLPDGCVDLICCSPPYFGLRSYVDAGQHYDGQIGSEATPREWLAALVECTREWVRVLKPSGSIFVNLGDKYDSGTTTARINPGTVKDGKGQGWHQGTPRVSLGQPKSLLGLPWRYALACMDELGLILRRDIIWSKPNGLPESVTDRCRSSHEYVFHLVRQPRYYAAVDEIREPHTGHTGNDPGKPNVSGNGLTHRSFGRDMSLFNPPGKLPGSVWEIPSQPLTVPSELGVDHFAAFPMELPRRIILGWSPPGICTACGEGRRPVSEGGGYDPAMLEKRGTASQDYSHRTAHGKPSPLLSVNLSGPEKDRYRIPHRITGYACACTDATAPVRPAVVVDPFGGTGTTALVAAAYGRLGFSVGLSADYCRLARWRTTDPAERAKAMQVPKPPPVPEGQASLFDEAS